MMIVSPTPVFRWTDNNGNPAVGWKVETYIAGSSTPVDTYTDATGTAENTNPIILDARGEAKIWLDPAISYKYVIKNNLGVVQDTIDQIQAGSGGSGGLTRVYYNDSSSIAYSGLGTLATPLSSSIKLSTQPNNALQVRADGLYAMAIGGGGSVAWGSITGNILAQTDLINKFNEYLPLTFSSPQVVTYTTEGQYVFANAGEFVAQNLAVGSAQNNFVSLKPFDLSVRFVDGVNAYDSKLTLATLTAGRTWTLPNASGTIALTTDIAPTKDALQTGVLTGYGISSAGGGTSIDVASGSCRIVSNASYPATISEVTTALTTNLAIPAGTGFRNVVVNTSGVVSLTTDIQIDPNTRCVLGYITFVGGVLSEVGQDPLVGYSASIFGLDLTRSLGPVRQGMMPSLGASLGFGLAEGRLTRIGVNYAFDRANPHTRTYSPVSSPVSFFYATQNNVLTTPSTAINPALRDDGSGGTTAVPSNRFTNQRFFRATNGQVFVQYGQVEYTTIEGAIAGLGSETFTPNPQFLTPAVIQLGALSIKGNATLLNDSTQARWSPASKLGEIAPSSASIQATPTLQQVTDAGNTTTTAINGSTASFSGNVTASLAPTLGGHLTNKTYVDNQIATREPSITAGTTAQYWRGDKSWQTLNTTAVTEGTNLYFTEARVRSSVLTGFSVGANSAIVATDSVLQAFGKTQGQINALVTASSDYIKRDGTSTTTATIPFAVGASFGDAPSGLAIQLTGASKWIGSGTSPTTGGSALLLDSTSWILRSNTGNTISTSTNNITYNNNAGSHIFQASGSNLYSFNSSVHSWDGGIGGSTAKYQFNGSAHIASTLRIGSIPTGTQVGLVGYDSNGNLIQGSAGSGFVTISGHNDLTTPWSIGDASTWGTSSAGIQIDPVGSYGLYLKGNAIIEQAVSQALSLYRPVASGDVCLNFDAWDSLGAQANYAQVCGVVVSNTAGSVGGGLDLEVAIAGVLTPLLQLRQAGSTLTGGLTASGNISVETNASDVGFYSRASGSAGIIGGVYVGRGQRGTLASPTATQSGDGLLWLGGQGYGDTGFSAGSRGVIRVRASENWTDLAQGAYISFETTATGGTTRAERGRIENNGVLTWLNRIDTTASTTTTAGLRVPHGTAPTSPVNGDIWTTTTAVLARINGTTRTFGLLGVANDWATIQTMRGVAVTGQTNTPTGTTYTWTLTSGNQLDITLTSSTGDVTITTASPSAGAYSILSATGHGTLARNLIITQSGVTFIMTGKTSGATITLDSIPATKRACYILYWITTTKCFIDRVTLEA